MFFEAEFWVAVAFAIFAAILWKAGAFRQMTDALDQRGKRIQAELDEAKRLREEAARVLADYQKRRTEAEREAEAIVSSAREEAERGAAERRPRRRSPRPRPRPWPRSGPPRQTLRSRSPRPSCASAWPATPRRS